MARIGNPLLNAPAAMIGSLTIAILFALGHHLFNWSLQRPGQVVPTSTFRQGINTSAGTAFAFLVKAALTVALGTAYTQLLFDTLLKNTLSIEITDILTGMLASTFQVCRVNLTWRYPCVLLLAVIYHLIAISTIVPPGTLSVSLRTMDNTTELAVPNLNWDYLKAGPLYSDTINAQTDSTPTYTVTSDFDISRIVTLTVLNKQTPPLPVFASNSSYELDVVGPAIQCSTANHTSSPVLEFMKTWRPYCGSDADERIEDLDWAGYMAWVPDMAHYKEEANVQNTYFGINGSNVPINNDRSCLPSTIQA